MSNLFSTLHLGAGSLLANQAGISVAQKNTANVNTEGYVRESVDLRSEPGLPLSGGVRADGPLRANTSLLTARERQRAGEFGQAKAFASATDQLEASMTTAQRDLGLSIADMFARFGELAATPTDEVARQVAIDTVDAVATSFRDLAAEVDAGRDDADARIEAHAGQASVLAAEIADLNQAIKLGDDPTLLDRRELAAQKLSDLIGGAARVDPDGHMRFVVAGGVVVVDGDRAATVATSPDPALGGRLRVEIVDGIHRDDVTARLDGGQLAGELQFRDGAAAQHAAELDQLASDLATHVNTVHSANAGLDGVTGRNLFVPTASASGMRIDPAIAADPSKLAAAAAGANTGDNQGALALLDLRDQQVAAGGVRTLGDEAIGLSARFGLTVSSAQSNLDVADARRDALAAVRDAVAGVSIEEEMARLSQFVHATEASIKVISTVDNLLGTLIQGL